MAELMRINVSLPGETPIAYMERIYATLTTRRSYDEYVMARDHSLNSHIASTNAIPSYYYPSLLYPSREPGLLMPRSPVHIVEAKTTTKALPQAEKAKSRFIDLKRGKNDCGSGGS